MPGRLVLDLFQYPCPLCSELALQCFAITIGHIDRSLSISCGGPAEQDEGDAGEFTACP